MKQPSSSSTATAQGSPTLGRALLTLVLIAAFVAAYLLLAGAMDLKEPWAGFLWLLYWAGMEQMQTRKFLPSLLGGAVGLAAALMVHLLPAALGTGGLIIALCFIAVLVLSQLMQWLPTLVSNATMLFLTVATIQHLQAHGDFVQMYLALALGGAFFGGFLLSLGALRRRPSRAPEDIVAGDFQKDDRY
jgi:hypothetical protein